MTNPPPSPAEASRLPWWLIPGVIGVLAVGGVLTWANLPPADFPKSAPFNGSSGPPPGRRMPPARPDVAEHGPVHWVGHGVENGIKVVYIQAVPGGDILVVDATTGRLIETRPTSRMR